MRAVLRRREHAVTTTTFALIAPVFLFIIFAASEGSRIMFSWMVITNEAAEAARYAAVHYDEDRGAAAQETDVRTFVNNRLDGILDPTGLVPAPQVVITTTNPPMVSVTLSYKVDLVIPIISDLLPDPFPLKARSIMAAEFSES